MYGRPRTIVKWKSKIFFRVSLFDCDVEAKSSLRADTVVVVYSRWRISVLDDVLWGVIIKIPYRRTFYVGT
jgi:hypothetical protein